MFGWEQGFTTRLPGSKSWLRRNRNLLSSLTMKLPGGTGAIVELSKLRDYCLDPHHPRGRHKAWVFLSGTGFPAERGRTPPGGSVPGSKG